MTASRPPAVSSRLKLRADRRLFSTGAGAPRRRPGAAGCCCRGLAVRVDRASRCPRRGTTGTRFFSPSCLRAVTARRERRREAEAAPLLGQGAPCSGPRVVRLRHRPALASANLTVRDLLRKPGVPARGDCGRRRYPCALVNVVTCAWMIPGFSSHLASGCWRASSFRFVQIAGGLALVGHPAAAVVPPSATMVPRRSYRCCRSRGCRSADMALKARSPQGWLRRPRASRCARRRSSPRRMGAAWLKGAESDDEDDARARCAPSRSASRALRSSAAWRVVRPRRRRPRSGALRPPLRTPGPAPTPLRVQLLGALMPPCGVGVSGTGPPTRSGARAAREPFGKRRRAEPRPGSVLLLWLMSRRRPRGGGRPVRPASWRRGQACHPRRPPLCRVRPGMSPGSVPLYAPRLPGSEVRRNAATGAGAAGMPLAFFRWGALADGLLTGAVISPARWPLGAVPTPAGRRGWALLGVEAIAAGDGVGGGRSRSRCGAARPGSRGARRPLRGRDRRFLRFEEGRSDA